MLFIKLRKRVITDQSIKLKFVKQYLCGHISGTYIQNVDSVKCMEQLKFRMLIYPYMLKYWDI